jgi:hypothetical protein
MVANRRSEEVVDPTIQTRPSTRELKKALLAALRCVDPDSNKRPHMGQVVHMLEPNGPNLHEVPNSVVIDYCFSFSFCLGGRLLSLHARSGGAVLTKCGPLISNLHILSLNGP